MDSALKQTAVVAETVPGTTPATPSFKILRDITATGAPQRNDRRSPERRGDRMAANMSTGLASYPRAIQLPFTRDAGTDILWASLLCNAWAVDALKNASARQPFTLEEKFAGSGANPYRRQTGCIVDGAQIAFQVGDPGRLTFNLKGFGESMDNAAIAGATYAQPSPGEDPVTPADIKVNDLFGIADAKVMALNMTIANNTDERWSWGSVDPFEIGLGAFDVNGQVQFYFGQSSDYSTFMQRQSGVTLDLTLGRAAGKKDQLIIPKADVWNPDISDPGASGAHLVTLNFMARFDATSNAALSLKRNVA